MSVNTNKTVFESRINALRHIAGRYPCWVGRAELAEQMAGCDRTHQRILRELIDLGYIESDQCCPKGYRLIKGKFKEFQGL